MRNPTGGWSADRVPGRRKRLAIAANHCGATPPAGRLYHWTLVSVLNRERKRGGDEEWGEKQTTEKKQEQSKRDESHMRIGVEAAVSDRYVGNELHSLVCRAHHHRPIHAPFCSVD